MQKYNSVNVLAEEDNNNGTDCVLATILPANHWTTTLQNNNNVAHVFVRENVSSPHAGHPGGRYTIGRKVLRSQPCPAINVIRYGTLTFLLKSV